MIAERAPAKVNLLLHVGDRRADGLHELCSLFASIDLADQVTVRESADGKDRVTTPGVEGDDLCAVALRELRRTAGRASVPPLEVEVDKRVPVAAGLGGGSADAAAVLRAANRLAGEPLDQEALRAVGARVGADVPSQIAPGHALVQGAGERVEPLSLPLMALVLLPQERGLSTAEVYEEADRIGATRRRLNPEAVRAIAARQLELLAPSLENDLEAPVLSLRPELAEALAVLEETGALAALVTGAGPTVFGVFEHAARARDVAERLPGALVTSVAGR